MPTRRPRDPFRRSPTAPISPEDIDALISRTQPGAEDDDEEVEEDGDEGGEEAPEPTRPFRSRLRPAGPRLPPTRPGRIDAPPAVTPPPAEPAKSAADSRKAQEDERARMRERRSVQDFCYRCGSPFPKDLLSCPGCGSEDRERGKARPRIEAPDETMLFEPPWDLLPWPKQGCVALFGGPGSGKSTLASLIKPLVWITKEQDPKPVGAMFRRVLPGFMPEVVAVNNARQVAEALSIVERGPVVIDSLTAFGLKDALLAGHLLVNWCRDHNDRGLAILQVNKEGDTAGLMEIPHLVDAIIETSPDAWGVRAFQVRKSRWSGLEGRYWTFDAQGRVSMPVFDAAYSVEGGPGNYWLHPFPMRGAKWAGLLDVLAEERALRPKVACAAMEAPYMAYGFVEPQDTPERRRFAETHDLEWITPQRADEMIVEAKNAERMLGAAPAEAARPARRRDDGGEWDDLDPEGAEGGGPDNGPAGSDRRDRKNTRRKT